MSNSSSRRNFIKQSAVFGAGITLVPHATYGISSSQKQKLRIGLIGVGLRGTNHLNNLLQRDDVLVTAVCDIDSARIDLVKQIFKDKKVTLPKFYDKNDLDYRNLLELKDVDAVIIATPWLWHTRMSVDAMKAGKYTGVEVSAANTMEECWDLVNVHKETGTHLMILENVNYRRDILAVLNMVKQNIFGELIHFRCGYQHDLRFVTLNDGKSAYGKGVEFGDKGISESAWRTQHSVLRNADVYPTHGVGPMAVMCDINRGNRFVSMTSHATKSRGMHNYIVKNGGKDHPNAKVNFKMGDVITSTIETANGETIIVTHDVHLPRPYSLGFRVQGDQRALGKRW